MAEVIKLQPSKEDIKLLSKKRRRRTIIGQRDLEMLEDLFEVDRWPSREKKEILARKIGKSEIFINTWFQNRRARSRREEKSENKKLKFHTVEESVFKTKTFKRKDQDRTKGTQKMTNLVLPFLSERSAAPWDKVFARIIHMACASEDILLRTYPLFNDAIHDACKGIPLLDGKLVYNREYGLDIIDRQF